MKSDKGNRFTISSNSSYEKQGDKHTLHDRKISWEEVEKSQSRMNNLSRSPANIVGLGSNWGEKNTNRCWGNIATQSCIVPLLYPSPKTHKPVDPEGDPVSRPIVQASSCVTSRPGELLADIIEAAIMSYPGHSECQSTEDMLAKVDKAAETIREVGKDVCMGSGDAVALYPSLLHEESALYCADVIRRCPARFENIDTHTAAVFLATNCSENELEKSGLLSIIPRRIYARGFKLTASTPELTTRPGDKDPPPKFHKTRTIMAKEERELLAKVVQVGVRLVVKNHVYKWKGSYWKQSLGVPTGLRLSAIIGRVTMDVWRYSMQNLMKENNMTEYLLEKYVNDAEVLCENLPVGTRWDGKKMVTTPETEAADRTGDRMRDKITMAAWDGMASSVIPGLKFTTDWASNNNNKRVPMLDFELWCDQEQHPDYPDAMIQVVKYNFFEKAMTNPEVMHQRSAMPHKMKMATLTQEGFMRLCNTSRSLPDKEKCTTLSIYMNKLRKSGYSQKIRTDILEAAVKTFRRKQKEEDLGIRPVHRMGGHDMAARRRSRISGKAHWFRPKKDSWKTRLAEKEQMTDQNPDNTQHQQQHPP